MPREVKPFMDASVALSPGQRSHLRELIRFGCSVKIVGIDAGHPRARRPVISRTDSRNTVEYAIDYFGRGVQPRPPILPTDLTIETALGGQA